MKLNLVSQRHGDELQGDIYKAPQCEPVNEAGPTAIRGAGQGEATTGVHAPPLQSQSPPVPTEHFARLPSRVQ